MQDKSDVIELSLFPLNTVLFPGQVLPLHIFEQRYQIMIRRCLSEDLPFGVVLIDRGHDLDSSDIQPHAIGTIARIIESTHLPDGTMNIVTVGTERFRIHRLLHDQPYLRGEVENYPLPDPADPDMLVPLTTQVRKQVARYIELIAQAAGLQIQIGDVPDNPRQVSYLAAVAMQIDNARKQALLDSGSLGEILKAEVALLNSENALLAWMAQRKDWPKTVQFGPSGTLMPN